MKLENFLTIIYFLRYLLSSHLLSFDDANSTFIRPLEIVFTEPLFLFPSIFFFFLKFWVSNLLDFLFGSFLYLLIPLSSIILNILVFFFFFFPSYFGLYIIASLFAWKILLDADNMKFYFFGAGYFCILIDIFYFVLRCISVT